MSLNPKEFYDCAMTAKLGQDYERARWSSSPLLAAQYGMIADVIKTRAVPVLIGAKKILEVGPGPGTWTKVLLSAIPEARFTLVDISETMLSQARAELAPSERVSFVESDIASFTSDAQFDGFFSSRAIEYMPNKGAVLAHISSLLAPGAKGFLMTKMPKRFFDRLRGRRISDLHQGQVAPDELTRLFEAAGLRVRGVYIATATVPGLNSASANRAAYALLRRFGLLRPFAVCAESYAVSFEKS